MNYYWATLRNYAVEEMMGKFRKAAGLFPGAKLAKNNKEMGRLTPFGAIIAHRAFARQAEGNPSSGNTKTPKLNAKEYRQLAESFFETNVRKVVDLGGPNSTAGDGVVSAEELELAYERIQANVSGSVMQEDVRYALRHIEYVLGKLQHNNQWPTPP